jgi:two-component system sensor histidine kinase BarA
VKVLVSDTGPGISDENQRLLFRKFQQAANSFMTRDARGTGLGLYISKLLSEQMGGKIALEHSKVGVGTTFSFTLPAAKDGQPAKEIK